MEKGVSKGIKQCLLASIIIASIYLMSCLFITINYEQIIDFYGPSIKVDHMILPVSVMIDMILVASSMVFCIVLLLKGRKKNIHTNVITIGISVITGLIIITRPLAPIILKYEAMFISMNEGSAGVAAMGVINSVTQHVAVFANVSMILFYLGMGIWLGKNTNQDAAKINESINSAE